MTADMTAEERTELLDWVSACQSAYHIESTPGHRFGGLPGVLDENREALCEYVNELLAARAASPQPQDGLVQALTQALWDAYVQYPEGTVGYLAGVAQYEAAIAAIDAAMEEKGK